MKKIVFAAIAFLAVMAMACQNTDNGGQESASKENEAQIRQRVEEMIQMNEVNDASQLLTADMLALQTQAQSVHFWADFCPGFQWDLGTQDACSDEQEVNIEGIETIGIGAVFPHLKIILFSQLLSCTNEICCIFAAVLIQYHHDF